MAEQNSDYLEQQITEQLKQIKEFPMAQEVIDLLSLQPGETEMNGLVTEAVNDHRHRRWL